MSDNRWHCRDVGVMLQLLKFQWLTTCKLFIRIVLTRPSDCQCLYQSFTNLALPGVEPVSRFRARWTANGTGIEQAVEGPGRSTGNGCSHMEQGDKVAQTLQFFCPNADISGQKSSSLSGNGIDPLAILSIEA